MPKVVVPFIIWPRGGLSKLGPPEVSSPFWGTFITGRDKNSIHVSKLLTDYRKIGPEDGKPANDGELHHTPPPPKYCSGGPSSKVEV